MLVYTPGVSSIAAMLAIKAVGLYQNSLENLLLILLLTLLSPAAGAFLNNLRNFLSSRKARQLTFYVSANDASNQM